MSSILEGMRAAERKRKRRQRLHLITFVIVLLSGALAIDWAMESVLFSIIAALP